MSDDPLRELGKQLPWNRPDDARRESVRSSLLVAAAEGAHPSARRRWLLVGGGFAAGAFAAAAIAVIVVRSPGHATQTPSAVYAQIERSSAAELEHTRTQTATGTDELVRVHAGRVHLAVPAVRAGDHVRLQTGDAEVEGSGSYEVVVSGDALASVSVTAGTASVKVKAASQTVFLAAGQSWHSPVVTAELEIATQPPPPTVIATTVTLPVEPPVVLAPPQMIAPARAPAPEREPAPAPRSPSIVHPLEEPVKATETPPPIAAPQPAVTELPPKGQPSATEEHFRAGLALLREGKAAAAAGELGAAADTGDQPLASDARYFQAVALAKAGRAPDAERALVAFLDHAPKSVRRGRAAVMLGRLLLERGDRASARAWFDAASHDADPAVAAAGRAGLASLVP